MIRYEALLLAVPEITADEAKSIEQQFDKLVAKHQGAVLSFDRWGKYKLSYPVKKNEYGVYFLARWESPQSQPLVDGIKNFLAVALHDMVMRHVIIKLDPKKSLEYERPASLEDTPSREVGSYLKESKMDVMIADQSRHSDDDLERAEL